MWLIYTLYVTNIASSAMLTTVRNAINDGRRSRESLCGHQGCISLVDVVGSHNSFPLYTTTTIYIFFTYLYLQLYSAIFAYVQNQRNIYAAANFLAKRASVCSSTKCSRHEDNEPTIRLCPTTSSFGFYLYAKMQTTSFIKIKT